MANISSYNQLSNWNEDDDLLFVQQPDAPKKAHPSQMKEYILEGLDVESVGGTGKYISAISEADGKISATAETMDEVPTQDSNKPVKSGGVFNAIDDSVSLKTATGNPITLTDAANANAEELLMTIEPIQSGSGDPSPTNVRPISGLTEGKVIRTGKNLLPTTPDIIKTYNSAITWVGNVGTYAGITFEILTDERGLVTGIKANGTATSRISFTVSQLVKGYGDTKANVVMSETQGSDGTFVVAVWIQGGNAFTGRLASLYISNDYSLNIDNRTENCYLGIGIANGYTANNLIISPMIRLATETDPAYEPYTGETATITFGQTVYGGSVNFKTGELIVTHGMVDLGTLTWTYHSATSSYSDYFDTVLPNDSILGDSEIAANIISPIYKTIPSKWIAYPDYDNNVQALAKDSRRFITCDKRFNSAADYTNAMAGIILVYELATPTTLTLTPAELELLKGNNTITANGAEISIKYYPDNAIGVLAGRVDDKADKSDVAAALAKKDNITTVEIPRFITSQAGWRRICKIKPVDLQTVEGMIYVGGFWSNGQQPSATVAVSIMNSTASLTLLSSAFLGTKRITAMRLVADTEIEFWLDVYFPAYSSLPGPFKLKFTGDIAVSDIQDPISITTDATAATDEISLDQKVSGTVLTDKSAVETISGTGAYGSTYTAYKYGRIVQLSVRNVTNETTEQAMILFSLPEGWRPIIQTDGVGTYFNASYDAATLGVVFRIDTNGDVKTYSYRAFNNGRVDITYITN